MIAFHAIIAAYGFWLPNDPRGSYSTYVGSRKLYDFAGQATIVTTRHSVTGKHHDHYQRVSAKALLNRPAVIFNGQQGLSIAGGIAHTAEESSYQVLALAVMPSHVHMVIGTSQNSPSQVIGHLKRGASSRLIADERHPCSENGHITHSCWAKRAWKVFLDTEKQTQRAIRYVEDNPLKEGKAKQRWSFVVKHREAWYAAENPPTARQADRLTASRSG